MWSKGGGGAGQGRAAEKCEGKRRRARDGWEGVKEGGGYAVEKEMRRVREGGREGWRKGGLEGVRSG